VGRFPHQSLGSLQVRRDIRAGVILDEADGEWGPWLLAYGSWILFHVLCSVYGTCNL
jgi:hypothetical protein